MTDQAPTTVNGPLHTPDSQMDDRLMRATYPTPHDAAAARDLLIQSGIAADRITVVDDASDSGEVDASLQPKDKSLVGRIREAVLPDDGTTATRSAVRGNEAILELRPEKAEVETAIRILQSCNPTHFDASLERWRNLG